MSETHFFLGYDPAPSARVENDDAAMVILRAIDLRSPEHVNDRAPVVTDFQCDYVWARVVRGMSPRKCSGMIYELDERYGFSNILMDPQGGGLGILKEMEESVQVVKGIERTVIPIVTRDATNFTNAQFKMTLMRRSDPAITKLWGDKFQGDDQMLAAMHGEFCEAVNNAWFGLPPHLKDLTPEQRAKVPYQSELEYALRVLDAGREQLVRIAVLVGIDGTVLTTRRGARQFVTHGRKDIAYAMIYAWIAFLSWLRMYDETDRMASEDEPLFGGF